MGYNIRLIKERFLIYKDNIPDALLCLRETHARHYGKTKFDWVDGAYIWAHTIREALKCWNYKAYFDFDGNLVSLDFIGEKLGDEVILFETIATYVQEGSFLQFEGEDNARWAYYFTGNSMMTLRCPPGQNRPGRMYSYDGTYR